MNMDEKQAQIAMGATMMARKHVAMAMARKGITFDTEAPTAMPVGQVMAQAQQSSAPVAAPAPVTTTPAPAAVATEPVNPWRRVIDKANGKRAAEPKTSAWSAAIARINERLAAS